MGVDHGLTTTITVPRPRRRLLATLREAVLAAQQDPQQLVRQGRELTDLGLAVRGDQLELTCTFGVSAPGKD